MDHRTNRYYFFLFRQSLVITSTKNVPLLALFPFVDVSLPELSVKWRCNVPSWFVAIIYTLFANTIVSRNDTLTPVVTCHPVSVTSNLAILQQSVNADRCQRQSVSIVSRSCVLLVPKRSSANSKWRDLIIWIIVIWDNENVNLHKNKTICDKIKKKANLCIFCTMRVLMNDLTRRQFFVAIYVCYLLTLLNSLLLPWQQALDRP